MRAAREWLRDRYPYAEIREGGVGLLLVVGAEGQPGVMVHERDRYVYVDNGMCSISVNHVGDVIDALERAHAAFDAYRLWPPPSAQGRAAKVSPRGGR